MVFIKKKIKSNRLLYKITKTIYNFYNKFIDETLRFYSFKKHVKNSIKINKNNIFFLLEQEHGNLGDIAIGYAEMQFLRDCFPEYNLIDVTEREYNAYKEYIKSIISPNDIITLIGGGSLGDEYVQHELSRKDIIKEFRENIIISFPQSMYFKDKSLEEESRKIYSTNSNLILIARDKISYGLMKNTFVNNKILLTPDIVLYLNKTLQKKNRNGALTLIRSDVESILTLDEKKYIYSVLNSRYNTVTVSDTVINNNVPRQKAEQELDKLFEIIKKAEIVVTDRLHGMIFAAITSTPCIVISNYNHKIKGQYEWIKHLNYIRFVDEISGLDGTLEELNKVAQNDYDNNFTKKYYKQIVNEIR